LLLRRQTSGSSWFEANSEQIFHETLSQKYPTHKGAGGAVQAVECLTHKCEALSLNSSPTKINLKIINFKIGGFMLLYFKTY
jgi:hypothetical protein